MTCFSNYWLFNDKKWKFSVVSILNSIKNHNKIINLHRECKQKSNYWSKVVKKVSKTCLYGLFL